MKTLLLLMILSIIFQKELIGQQRFSVKLNKTQIQNLKIEKNRSFVDITFGDELIDKVLKNNKFTDFYQTYPLAKFFTHPASERVSHYYTFVLDSANNNFFLEIQTLKVFEIIEPINDPITNYLPNDFALVDPPFSTPDRGSQWYLTHISAQQAWDKTKGSATVKIGVVDNGFNVTHEDLMNQIVFTDGDVTGAADSHGSLVSGIAAAETDNAKGLSSIGFNSKLMLYLFQSPFDKMMDASLNGAKVINTSWYTAGCSYSQAEQDIVNMIVANGTTIVSAAGNGTVQTNCGDPDGYAYPACYDNVISVSGTFYDSYFDDGSNVNRFTFNDKVDLTAPGWHLMTTGGSNPTFYTRQSGTSLSAPLVTGTVALMYSLKSCLTPYEVEYILKKAANKGVFNTELHPENAPFVNTSGAGRLDANVAIDFTQAWPQNLPVGSPFLGQA